MLQAVIHEYGRQFLVEELEVDDSLLADQQVVQEVDQKRLGKFLPKDTFETNVRKRIDIICHS